MANVFDLKVRGQYIYQQYRSLTWLRDYAGFIDSYIQITYYDSLQEMWDTMNVAESEDPYLTFYTKWLFGLYRPLGGASVSDYFDIGLPYDSSRIYDDASENNGLILADEYLKYIKFIYDYSEPTWSLDYIMRFAADYCDISPLEITIDLSDKNSVVFVLPPTQKTQDFTKIIINYADEMCLPFGNVINFKVEE